jgi:Na+-transporting methylmalonyl-CoA/oxaloacetate decarboxylase gamma subunit
MRKLYILTGFLLTCALPVVAQEGISGDTAEKIQKFQEHDPYGVSMAIIAMGVVFCALLILFLCFKWSGKVLNKGIRSSVGLSKAPKAEPTAPKVVETATGKPADTEVAAAIGMALFLNEDGMHDNESEELTLVSTQQAWTGCGANHKQHPLRKF